MPKPLNHIRQWWNDPEFWRDVAVNVLSAVIFGIIAFFIAAAFGLVGKRSVLLASAALALLAFGYVVGYLITGVLTKRFGHWKSGIILLIALGCLFGFSIWTTIHGFKQSA